MQNIYSISVKNGQKLKTLLRVEIEKKIDKKKFVLDQKIFFCCFFRKF